MVRNIITYPIQFVFLVLLQAVVLNNVQFSSFINPYVYILFLLWLPLETPKALLLFLGFLLGLSVDIFSNTLGMHTSAAIFLAFCRPFVLQFIAPRDGYELNQQPGIKDFGWSWFFIYAATLTFLHHLFLFYVEVLRFSDFFNTLGRVFASWFFSLIIIFIAQLFRYNAEERR